MNIKGKIVNLPGYCVITQNKAGRCRNRDIGKAKPKTDGTNPHKIFFPIFLDFSDQPRASTRLGRLGARDRHAPVVFSGDGHAGDLGFLHRLLPLLQSIPMSPLGARKDHRKRSKRSLEASAGRTASKLRRGSIGHQNASFARQSFQNQSSCYGQQKPLNPIAQFDPKTIRFEAQKC